MLATLFTAVYFFACGVLAHLALCWLVPSSKFMRDGLLTGFCTLLSAVIWQFRSGAADPVALYLLLTAWLAYLMFFINLLNSVTLKMLERLALSEGGSLRDSDFAAVFNEESGLRARLGDMRANGFITAGASGLALTSKARIFLSVVSLIRKLLAAG